MRIVRKKLNNVSLLYPLERLAPIKDVLFLDIETTGFAAKSSILYLIGCAYYDEDESCWQTIQWFATVYDDEKDVVESFFQFAKDYQYLIHFNGNNFDIPFIKQKCEQYQLPYTFDHFDGIDIYKHIVPFRDFLGLPNCKLKSIEQFLGIKRNDPFDGGQLISIYHDFVRQETDFAYNAMLCHNQDDLAGMFQILPILAFSDLFTQTLKVKKVQANTYHDINNNSRHELYMRISLPVPLLREIDVTINGCHFSGAGKVGNIRVPLYVEEMKYFYNNYKDYYYLPLEDTAIHKSVAAFVDQKHREQAKASNCYTKKKSSYLPQWNYLFTPFFKREYTSPDLFFEITDSFKQDRDSFSKYASHILQMMATHGSRIK